MTTARGAVLGIGFPLAVGLWFGLGGAPASVLVLVVGCPVGAALGSAVGFVVGMFAVAVDHLSGRRWPPTLVVGVSLVLTAMVIAVVGSHLVVLSSPGRPRVTPATWLVVVGTPTFSGLVSLAVWPIGAVRPPRERHDGAHWAGDSHGRFEARAQVPPARHSRHH